MVEDNKPANKIKNKTKNQNLGDLNNKRRRRDLNNGVEGLNHCVSKRYTERSNSDCSERRESARGRERRRARRKNKIAAPESAATVSGRSGGGVQWLKVGGSC